MMRLSAACSSRLAHQPITRDDANVGVNRSAGQPAVLHHDAGVELDVGVQVAARLQLGEHVDHGLLDLLGELDLRRSDPLGDAVQEARRGSSVL